MSGQLWYSPMIQLNTPPPTKDNIRIHVHQRVTKKTSAIVYLNMIWMCFTWIAPPLAHCGLVTPYYKLDLGQLGETNLIDRDTQNYTHLYRRKLSLKVVLNRHIKITGYRNSIAGANCKYLMVFFGRGAIHPMRVSDSILIDDNEWRTFKQFTFSTFSHRQKPISGALPIYRGHFSLYNTQKTPHSSPVREIYGVLFLGANLTNRIFKIAIVVLCALACHI